MVVCEAADHINRVVAIADSMRRARDTHFCHHDQVLFKGVILVDDLGLGAIRVSAPGEVNVARGCNNGLVEEGDGEVDVEVHGGKLLGLGFEVREVELVLGIFREEEMQLAVIKVVRVKVICK